MRRCEVKFWLKVVCSGGLGLRQGEQCPNGPADSFPAHPREKGGFKDALKDNGNFPIVCPSHQLVRENVRDQGFLQDLDWTSATSRDQHGGWTGVEKQTRDLGAGRGFLRFISPLASVTLTTPYLGDTYDSPLQN